MVKFVGKFENLSANELAYILGFLRKREIYQFLTYPVSKSFGLLYQENQLKILLKEFFVFFDLFKLVRNTEGKLNAPMGIFGRKPELIYKFIFEGYNFWQDTYLPLMMDITGNDDFKTRLTQVKSVVEYSIKISHNYTRLRYLRLAAPITLCGMHLKVLRTVHPDLMTEPHINPQLIKRYDLEMMSNTQAGITLWFYLGMFSALLFGSCMAAENCVDGNSRIYPFQNNASLDCDGAGAALILGFLGVLIGIIRYIVITPWINGIVRQRDAEDKENVKNLLEKLNKLEEKDVVIDVSDRWNKRSKSFSSLLRTPGIGMYSTEEIESLEPEQVPLTKKEKYTFCI